MSDKKDNKKKKIGKALSYVGDTLKGIATANAGHQSTNYTPAGEPKQKPVDIDPFGTDNDAPA